jgi:putative RNA 2'-phosphotransferase
LPSIREQGLLKMQRQHVHLSTDHDLMLQVGARHGKPIVLSIAADRMAGAGHLFFITANQVWLTAHVPVQYLTIPGA